MISDEILSVLIFGCPRYTNWCAP